MNAELRPSTEADQSAIKRLLDEVWHGDKSAPAYHGGGRLSGVVAVQDGQIVGYAHTTRKRLHPTHTYVGVHVAPHARGQGIGRRLWQRMTANCTGTLKTATYSTEQEALAFLQKRGLAVSVRTQFARLALAQLDAQKLKHWQAEAEGLGFTLLPMQAVQDTPPEDLVALHRAVYAHTHQHDPPDVSLFDEEDVLSDDLNPRWLYVARQGTRLAGVGSVRFGEMPTQGELGWCGVAPEFAQAGPILTRALAGLALQAAQQDGLSSVLGEFDSVDRDMVELYVALPWENDLLWLTLTTPPR